MLDVDIGWFRRQDNGQPLVQFGFHGGQNQQFEVVATGSGPHWTMPRHTRRKVLDVAGASTADGGPVQQWAQQINAPQQMFLIEPVGAYYRIMAAHSGKVLDVSAVSLEDSARVHQWTWVEGDNQWC